MYVCMYEYIYIHTHTHTHTHTSSCISRYMLLHLNSANFMKDDKYRRPSQCGQSEVTYTTTISPHRTLKALTQSRLTTLYAALQCM